MIPTIRKRHKLANSCFALALHLKQRFSNDVFLLANISLHHTDFLDKKRIGFSHRLLDYSRK